VTPLQRRSAFVRRCLRDVLTKRQRRNLLGKTGFLSWQPDQPLRGCQLIGLHATRHDQNLTIMAPVIRFSRLRKSGVNPGTTEPGAPVLPPGGVTPPEPEKYGTFAAR
jgi:hypothetical protein